MSSRSWRLPPFLLSFYIFLFTDSTPPIPAAFSGGQIHRPPAQTRRLCAVHEPPGQNSPFPKPSALWEGFSCGGARALEHVGSVVVAQGLSCPEACGVLRQILNRWTTREGLQTFCSLGCDLPQPPHTPRNPLLTSAPGFGGSSLDRKWREVKYALQACPFEPKPWEALLQS
jgi:hypothetical protein